MEGDEEALDVLLGQHYRRPFRKVVNHVIQVIGRELNWLWQFCLPAWLKELEFPLISGIFYTVLIFFLSIIDRITDKIDAQVYEDHDKLPPLVNNQWFVDVSKILLDTRHFDYKDLSLHDDDEKDDDVEYISDDELICTRCKSAERRERAPTSSNRQAVEDAEARLSSLNSRYVYCSVCGLADIHMAMAQTRPRPRNSGKSSRRERRRSSEFRAYNASGISGGAFHQLLLVVFLESEKNERGHVPVDMFMNRVHKAQEQLGEDHLSSPAVLLYSLCFYRWRRHVEEGEYSFSTPLFANSSSSPLTGYSPQPRGLSLSSQSPPNSGASFRRASASLGSFGGISSLLHESVGLDDLQWMSRKWEEERQILSTFDYPAKVIYNECLRALQVAPKRKSLLSAGSGEVLPSSNETTPKKHPQEPHLLMGASIHTRSNSSLASSSLTKSRSRSLSNPLSQAEGYNSPSLHRRPLSHLVASYPDYWISRKKFIAGIRQQLGRAWRPELEPYLHSLFSEVQRRQSIRTYIRDIFKKSPIGSYFRSTSKENARETMTAKVVKFPGYLKDIVDRLHALDMNEVNMMKVMKDMPDKPLSNSIHAIQKCITRAFKGTDENDHDNSEGQDQYQESMKDCTKETEGKATCDDSNCKECHICRFFCDDGVFKTIYQFIQREYHYNYNNYHTIGQSTFTCYCTGPCAKNSSTITECEV